MRDNYEQDYRARTRRRFREISEEFPIPTIAKDTVVEQGLTCYSASLKDFLLILLEWLHYLAIGF